MGTKTIVIDKDNVIAQINSDIEDLSNSIDNISDSVDSAQTAAESAETSAASALTVATAATQAVDEALTGKADTTVTDGLQTQVTQNADDIALKADQTDLDNLSSTVDTNTASIQLRATKTELQTLSDTVDTKADQTDLDTANTAISENSDAIDSANAAIQLRATKTELQTLSDTVDTKADQTSLDTTNSNVSDNADAISQNAVDIQARALQADLDTTNTTVATKADQTDLDSAVSDIAQNATDIALKADQTDLDTTNTTVATKADQTDLDTLEARVTQNEDDLAAIPSDVTALAETVAENTAAIELKADQTSLDTLSDTVDTKADQTSLDTLSDTVSTKVDQTDFDALEVSVAENQTSIDDIESVQTIYDSWASLTGSLNKGSIVNHNSEDWLLTVDLTDVTTSEPSYTNSDYKDLLSEKKSVAIALNTNVSNVAVYQTGVSLTASVLRDTANELTLIAWDTLTTPYVITSYSANDHLGYNVVTDQGTFEFVTEDIKKLREMPNLAGWTDAFVATEYSTNDISDALTLANEYAHTVEKPLLFPEGWAQVSTGLWDLDISKTNWLCLGDCTLYATDDTPDYYLNVFSSLGSSQTRRNTLFAQHMVGIHLVGNSLTDTTGIVIGKSGQTTEQVDLSYGTVKGFSTLVDFKNDSTWCSNFKRYFFYEGAMDASTSQTNSFEREVFENCFFTLGSGNQFTINTGDWVFNHCSLDNSQVINNGDARVMMTDIHFEQPNKSGAGYADNSRYIKITSSTGVVSIKNADVLLTTNDETDINYAPFYVDESNEYAGLILDGISFTNTNYFTPEVNDDYRQYVAGGGRVRAQNITSTGGGHPALIASTLGLLSNQDFATGDTTGWTISGTADDTVQSAEVQTGTYALQIDLESGETSTIRQLFELKGNKTVRIGIWDKFDTDGSDASVSYALNFYDYSDNLLGSEAMRGTLTTTRDWSYGTKNVVSPAGTAYARVEFYIDAGTTTSTFYLDSTILNDI